MFPANVDGDECMSTDIPKRAYSIAEFARLAGVGRSFLYEQIRCGRLKVRKAGRRTLVLNEEGAVWFANLPSASRRASSNSTKR
jgi:hypothetical protein